MRFTYASIAWTLLDPSGASVGANAIITVLDPPTAGTINIKLTAATTAALAPRRYTEVLRITRAGWPVDERSPTVSFRSR